LLACYMYLQKVYAEAKGRQGKYLPQVLAPTASFLGRYRDALRWDPFKHGSRDRTSHVPLPGRYHAVDVVEWVAKLAKHREDGFSRDSTVPTIYCSVRSVTRAERRFAVNPRMAVTTRFSCGDNAVYAETFSPISLVVSRPLVRQPRLQWYSSD